MVMEKIYRLHYRAQLKDMTGDMLLSEKQEAVRQCVEAVRKAQQEGKLLTAALYYDKRALYFYYEAMGQDLAVTEPIAAKEGEQCLPESGEDVQASVLKPWELLAPLNDFLQSWPGQTKARLWVHMYHIYYHDIPDTVEGWKRERKPERRRGRIAFLRDSKLFSYVYYHKGLVDEGLICGDRYQSIALHENILFSYFEEPRGSVNIKKDYEHESKVLEEWLAIDPESHFIHMPEGEGANFMFLPEIFALGVEDAE